MFSVVSAASASAAAKTFPSHIKIVWAKPFIFGTNNIWVWGNVLDYLSMTLTQGHGCGVDWHKFACLHDRVRTTHRSTTKLGSFVANVMVIFWLDFGEIVLETVIFGKFSLKIWDVFFQGQILFWPFVRNGWSNWYEMKNYCIGWILGTICDLELWPHSWPWPWMFQGQISK